MAGLSSNHLPCLNGLNKCFRGLQSAIRTRVCEISEIQREMEDIEKREGLKTVGSRLEKVAMYCLVKILRAGLENIAKDAYYYKKIEMLFTPGYIGNSASL